MPNTDPPFIVSKKSKNIADTSLLVKLNGHPYVVECLTSTFTQNAKDRPVDVLYEGEGYAILDEDASVVI
jgi:hypothetical protein